MRMLKYIIFCCLIAFTYGAFNVKFNKLLDAQFERVNALLSRANVHRIPLRDTKVDDQTLKGISAGDIATFQRIGDATMKATDDSTLQTSLRFGLKNLTLHVDSYSSPRGNYTDGTYDIKKNSMSWVYSVSFTPSGGCSFKIDTLEITDLEDITLHSSNPKLNNIDVTKYFQPIKQKINDYFKSDRFKNFISRHELCGRTTDGLLQYFLQLE